MAVAGTTQPPPSNVLSTVLLSLLGLLRGCLLGISGSSPSVSPPSGSHSSRLSHHPPLCLAHHLVFTQHLRATGHRHCDCGGGGWDVLPVMELRVPSECVSSRAGGRRRKAGHSGEAGSQDPSWRGRGRMESDVKIRGEKRLRAGRANADRSSKMGPCRERREVPLSFVKASSSGVSASPQPGTKHVTDDLTASSIGL